MRRHWILSICYALVLGAVTPAAADVNIAIPQGWSAAQKADWYTRSQGSRLIPLSWLLALEQADSQLPFLDSANIEKFRYLANASPRAQGLPVGFAIDQRDDRALTQTKLRWKVGQSTTEKWVGMNCSACHTAEITYQGKRVRIEGGPTLADFQGFIESLNKALVAAQTEPKAARFAANVLKDKDTPSNRAMLQDALSKLVEWQRKIESINKPPQPYGFGRLDAFGHIFNKVALTVGATNQTFHPSDAPVSYPFLWNVPQHDKVQWNGLVKNSRIGANYDIGALGRNVGEVTGVFADVKISSSAGIRSVSSTADVGNLNVLEQKLSSLRPPLWPTGMLGKLDQAKRDRGREIFRDEKRTYQDQPVKSCASCHRPLGRNNLSSLIDAKMIPLKHAGTDIWMACNSVIREVKTGIFQTVQRSFIYSRNEMRYEDKGRVADLLRTTVVGTIWAKKGEVFRDVLRTFQFPSSDGLGSTQTEVESALPLNERPARSAAKQDIRNQCINGTDELLAYKARPLTGIWATAPYLHNGSVPTLYDLLLPPDQRPKSFPVGTREFDPVRVGFATRDADGKIRAAEAGEFTFDTRNLLGRVIDGNSNAGHDYGNAGLTDEQRYELVEYMKGL